MTIPRALGKIIRGEQATSPEILHLGKQEDEEINSFSDCVES